VFSPKLSTPWERFKTALKIYRSGRDLKRLQSLFSCPKARYSISRSLLMDLCLNYFFKASHDGHVAGNFFQCFAVLIIGKSLPISNSHLPHSNLNLLCLFLPTVNSAVVDLSRAAIFCSVLFPLKEIMISVFSTGSFCLLAALVVPASYS